MDSDSIFAFFILFFIAFSLAYALTVMDGWSSSDSEEEEEEEIVLYITMETPDAAEMKKKMDKIMVYINEKADEISKSAGNADTELAKVRLGNATKVLLLAQAELDNAVLLSNLAAQGIDPPPAAAAKFTGAPLPLLRRQFLAAAEEVKASASMMRDIGAERAENVRIPGGEIVRYRLKSTPVVPTADDMDRFGSYRFNPGNGPASTSKLVLSEGVRGFATSVAENIDIYTSMQERREKGLGKGPK